MDKRNRKKGLTIIGAEVQGSSKDDIEKVVKDARAEYPITKGTTRSPTMKGIPHAVVFDAGGALVFAGHPMDDEFERTIKKALRDVDLEKEDEGGLAAMSGPLIDSRVWTNAEGKEITAAVMSVDGDRVRFRLSNGKEVPYEIAKLSEDDQAVIKAAAEDKDDE